MLLQKKKKSSGRGLNSQDPKDAIDGKDTSYRSNMNIFAISKPKESDKQTR